MYLKRSGLFWSSSICYDNNNQVYFYRGYRLRYDMRDPKVAKICSKITFRVSLSMFIEIVMDIRSVSE